MKRLFRRRTWVAADLITIGDSLGKILSQAVMEGRSMDFLFRLSEATHEAAMWGIRQDWGLNPIMVAIRSAASLVEARP